MVKSDWNTFYFILTFYSRVRFLWIACGSRESSLKEAVDGSLGVVVSWCDQLRVLCHTAVVGFWTHCGCITRHWKGCILEYQSWSFLWFGISFWMLRWLLRRDEVKELMKRFIDGETEEGKDVRRRGLRSQWDLSWSYCKSRFFRC